MTGILEEPVHLCGETVRIVARHDDADIGRCNDVTDAAHVGADAGNRRRHAFDQRDRRAFVARGEDEHIRGRVNSREIPTPAEKADVSAEAERAGRCLELGAQLAVARDQEDRVGVSRRDRRCRLEEERVLLDRSQPADGGHDGMARGDVQLRPRAIAGSVVDADERLEIEPEWNDAVLFRPADAVLVQKLVADSRRDRHDDVSSFRELPFHVEDELLRSPTEIPFEHVAMIGVNDSRARGSTGRTVVCKRREPSERACLRHVRVHQRRLELAEDPIEFRERCDVVNRRHRTAQAVDVLNRQRRIGLQVTHVAFARPETSVHEERFISLVRQTFRQCDGLNRRASHVEAGDHARDAHARHCSTRSAVGADGEAEAT